MRYSPGHNLYPIRSRIHQSTPWFATVENRMQTTNKKLFPHSDNVQHTHYELPTATLTNPTVPHSVGQCHLEQHSQTNLFAISFMNWNGPSIVERTWRTVEYWWRGVGVGRSSCVRWGQKPSWWRQSNHPSLLTGHHLRHWVAGLERETGTQHQTIDKLIRSHLARPSSTSRTGDFFTVGVGRRTPGLCCNSEAGLVQDSPRNCSDFSGGSNGLSGAAVRQLQVHRALPGFYNSVPLRPPHHGDCDAVRSAQCQTKRVKFYLWLASPGASLHELHKKVGVLWLVELFITPTWLHFELCELLVSRGN